MIIKKAIFLLVIAMVLLNTATMQDRLLKKAKKEIKKTFDIETFELITVEVPSEVNKALSKEIKPNSLFKIAKDSLLIGYAFIDKAPSKTDQFDYLILLDTNFIIAKTKVLVYREDYGGEIGSKRWLKQFIGKSTADHLKYEKNIIAISGATISAHAMTKAINTFLKNLDILYKNKVI